MIKSQLRKESVKPKCINQHFVERICLEKDCSDPAFICNKKIEGCQNYHKNCEISITVDGTINKLIRQQQLSESIDQEVLKCYDNIISTVKMFKDQYLKNMDKPQYRFKNNQRQLLKFLKQGPASQIFPKFVISTLKTLELSGTKFDEEKNKVLVKLEMCIQNIKKELLNMNIISGQDNIDQFLEQSSVLGLTTGMTYSFSDQFMSQQCFDIDNFNKVIQTTNQSFAYCRFALIVPHVQQKSEIRQKVKIMIKRSIGTFFGMYSLKAIQKSQYQSIFYDKLDHGAYLTDNSGWIYNSAYQQQNMVRSFKMQYLFGDIVQLQYLSKQKKLKITNISKNRQLFLDVKYPQDDKLYFCLGTSFDKDKYIIIE